MPAEPHLIAPEERVLSTLNADGSRRWLRPRPAHGAMWRRRRLVAYALMLVFVLVPYLRVAGKPLVLLDLPRREFTLLGTTFLPTETLLFMLLFASGLIGVFLVTALLGRVWCGWGCPQTVYLEFLYRPIEYAIEGGPRGVQALDRRGLLAPRRLLKHAVFLVLSVFLAHTFLAYFVGVERLAEWVRRSPIEHPTSFLVMLGTTALMFFDFAYFREQTCLVACPYGRLQSVLLDRRSLIVGYDRRRGEPRALGARSRAPGAGDCIDCRMCVQVCPTGIDIRDGLQMECLHCTQCADACDAVMTKIGKPAGLIRYGSEDGFAGRVTGFLRPRVVVYPVALLAGLALFAWQLGARAEADVTLLRGGEPYTTDAQGRVVNQVRVKIANRGDRDRRYRLALQDAPEAELVAPMNPLPVAAGGFGQTSVFVALPPSAIARGERDVRFRVTDERGLRRDVPYRLIGPEPADRVGARR